MNFEYNIHSDAASPPAVAYAVKTTGFGCPFLRDGWAKPWPVGPEVLCYMISHEAHHRGQLCMLAHQLGFPWPVKLTSGIWNWEKPWKECGAPGGPGRDSLPFV